MSREKDIQRIVKILLESERVHRQDLYNLLGGYTEQQMHLIVWQACELVKNEHGIDFGPLEGEVGYLARRGPAQIVRYAVKQRKKGTRAQERALGRMRLAAEKTPDEKERGRIERMAEREEERQHMQKKRIV